jgi:hypothetical protein
MKENESKMAFICFLLFSSIFRNRDFSKGYEQKNKKIFPRPALARQVVREAADALRSLLHARSCRRARHSPGPKVSISRKYTEDSWFSQGFVGSN